MSNMGVPVEKHHHEVAPSQHELGMKFGTLIDTADNLQSGNMRCTRSPMRTGVSNVYAKAYRWG